MQKVKNGDSRPPSRAGSNPASPQASPGTVAGPPAQSRRSSRDGGLPLHTTGTPSRRDSREHNGPPPTRRFSQDTSMPPPLVPIHMERHRSAESANGLHIKLQIATSLPPGAAEPVNSAFRTPTSSTFTTSTDSPKRPSGMARAVTQPNISPSLRPRSPPPNGSPARANTPISRNANLGVRPLLRPRHTTGSKIQVSFADQPESPRSVGDRTTTQAYLLHSRERTPSLVSSGSRVTSGYSRSSAAFSVSTLTGDEHASALDMAEDELDEATVMRLRERRMSGKTLQDARQRIFNAMHGGEELEDGEKTPVEHQDPADARGQAISQSLAALEGWRSTNPTTDQSPRHRVAIRRPYSIELGRQDVDKVMEEDENSSVSNSAISTAGSQPPMIRRVSLKVVPKRSMSPPPRPGTPTSGLPFPSAARATSVFPVSHTTSELGRPGDQGGRRQSERLFTQEAADGLRNVGMRNYSMVNLSTTSMGPPSLFRDNSSSSVLKATQPLQVLELHEPGFPSVKYVSYLCV